MRSAEIQMNIEKSRRHADYVCSFRVQFWRLSPRIRLRIQMERYVSLAGFESKAVTTVVYIKDAVRFAIFGALNRMRFRRFYRLLDTNRV
jgi:hypothetical protein